MFIEEVHNTVDTLVAGSKNVIKAESVKLKGLVAYLRGNAAVLVKTYLGFSIPSAWLGAYQSLYILSLGVTNIQYGNIVGLTFAVQIFAQLLGGIIPYRLGHRGTLNIFTLFWPASLIIFAFAENIWWVLPAIIMQNFIFISTPSWYCLFVEGIPKNKRSGNYAVLHILLNGGALFLPVAGLLVKYFGLDTASRTIYLVSVVITMTAIIFRWKYLTETKVGERAVSSKKPLNLLKEGAALLSVLKYLGRKKELFWFTTVNILFLAALTMWTSFNSIFLADSKAAAFKEWSIMVFPMISAVTFTLASLLFVPRIKKGNYLKYIGRGILLNAVASAVYIFAPAKDMVLIIISYMVYGVGLAFFRPLYDARLINAFKTKDQARLISVFNIVTMLPCVAVGPLTGLLYTGNPRYVYVAATAMFIFALIILRKKVK
ncbi:MAG: MFS transporter [Candidatus Firestonebacteria bacterium]|nr:MFS transporter [Candidatus Firestonebacteria bacterium]